jgi:hypothetical protein
VQQDIKKYKIVRRGPKWCVRVQGYLNTTESVDWCQVRKMSCHIKEHEVEQWWDDKSWWEPTHTNWDYDFIFDKEYEATAFILGYL